MKRLQISVVLIAVVMLLSNGNLAWRISKLEQEVVDLRYSQQFFDDEKLAGLLNKKIDAAVKYTTSLNGKIIAVHELLDTWSKAHERAGHEH